MIAFSRVFLFFLVNKKKRNALVPKEKKNSDLGALAPKNPDLSLVFIAIFHIMRRGDYSHRLKHNCCVILKS